MPWKTNNEVEARWRFIAERLAGKPGGGMTALCRRHGISRECGYKWWRRFCAGGKGALAPRSRRPRTAQRMWERWRERLGLVRRRCGDFGPKKLRWQLWQDYPRERPPAVCTLARWLEQAGRVRQRKRRSQPGAVVRLPGRLRGRHANEVWTVDLKGSFRTADGQRIHALTVRDLASRYVLCVRDVGRGDERPIGRVMRGLFRRHGLPRALRMDNGTPFGSPGPRGWSRLSASWVKLGLRLEYGRPACPQDNAAHEQMHRMLKERTARPPAATRPAQQRRFERWRQHYNHARPHEALGMRVPAARYRASPRPLPSTVPSWSYPAHWSRLRPDAKGRWRWQGRARHIGRALAQAELGGRPLGREALAIYFGPHLLGTLHRRDLTGIRAVQWRHQPKAVAGGAQPLPHPPRSF